MDKRALQDDILDKIGGKTVALIRRTVVTQNWRGRPLVSHEVIANLIAHTTIRVALKIRAELDYGKYLTRITISDIEFNA